MVQNGPGIIDDNVRSALKMAACDLHLKGCDQMHIISDVCDGIIKTDWETHIIGMRSGVLFRSQIEGPNGEYMVNFLLNSDDLRRGANILREMIDRGELIWVKHPEPIPCPALYNFVDLREASRRLN